MHIYLKAILFFFSLVIFILCYRNRNNLINAIKLFIWAIVERVIDFINFILKIVPSLFIADKCLQFWPKYKNNIENLDTIDMFIILITFLACLAVVITISSFIGTVWTDVKNESKKQWKKEITPILNNKKGRIEYFITIYIIIYYIVTVCGGIIVFCLYLSCK